MTKLEKIVARVRKGDRVRFRDEWFGGVSVTVSRRWLPFLQHTLEVTPEQVDAIRKELRHRQRRR